MFVQWGDVIKLMVGLFVIVDPIGSATLFLALTDAHHEYRPRVVRTSVLTMFVVLVTAAFVGRFVLQLFGISVESFKVIGGILFLLTSLDMLNASPSRTKHTPEEDMEAESRREFAVVPLGVPILAGPGAISWVLIEMARAPDTAAQGIVLGVIVVCSVATAVVLLLASALAQFLGTTGRNILTRLMGLVVGALAVEFIVSGLRAMVPAWH